MDKEFIKPKRVTVNALEYLSNVLKDGLSKDLQENQIICPICHGTGLQISDSVYGLSNDTQKHKEHFPYHNQYITSCNHCVNGVVNLCKYCGKELPRYSYTCDCDDYKKEKEDIRIKKEKDAIESAKKFKYDDEEVKYMNMFYSEFYECNDGYFSDWEDFFKYWDDCHSDDEKPMYVWATYNLDLNIDVEDVLCQACEDLHEDARDNLTDIKELREFIKNWTEKQSGVITYYQDNKLIEIPWGLKM